MFKPAVLKKIDLSLTNKQQHTIIEHIIAYVSPKHLTGLTLLASFSPEIFNDNPALYTYLAKHYSPAIFETIEKKRSKIKTDVFYDFICSKMKLTDFPTGLLQALGISLPIAITSVSKRLATPHNIQSFATADNGQVWAFNNKSVIRFYADDLIDKTGNAIDCQTITDEADLEITVRGREMITAIAIYADKIAIGYSKGRIEIKIPGLPVVN
ncbi:MAG: hypothetical protein HWD59_02240 [Coxiellaceae bacterium]|nr:MAG: hypothetical protein HWD59_02240 [Coxiellaceae bacterium]